MKMRVLFVFSANNNNVVIDPIFENQSDSLVQQGVKIDYYPIKGKGLIGYLKNILPLRKQIRANKYDVVHAHYSLSAFVASLSGCKPLVVSLMGSDVKSGSLYRTMIRLFAWAFSWSAIIVKSEDMYADLGISNAVIIPNGVNFDRFKNGDKCKSQQVLGWNSDKKHILFPSNPQRKEKNYSLAKSAIDSLLLNNIEIHSMVNVSNKETPLWYSAADIVLLTSLWEGSPNVIKEAMACNRPVVCTDVGDVRWLFGNTEGCYVCSSFTIRECSDKIRQALKFSEDIKYTDGRKRIEELGLDNKIVAKKLIKIYEKTLHYEAKIQDMQ